jgi:L-ascorbate metabolism protein UlaG (beta-lactamase superfamily)
MRFSSVATACLAMMPATAGAQEARLASHCFAVAQGAAQVIPASFGAPVAENTLRIRHVDHATFLLETAGGLTLATDYTGYLGLPDVVPDVVTMNNAHSTHWTARPDARIPHILQGWPSDGVPAEHRLDLGEVLVRNVTTDTRGPFGEGALAHGNSIFIFEVAGLCVGHLGHLHQIPSPAQLASIGRLDVVMVPVDGGYTMSVAAMAGVVRDLRARVVIPMHWFSNASLGVFLAEMAPSFQIVRLDQPDMEFSRDNLPGDPTIIVLEPAFLE